MLEELGSCQVRDMYYYIYLLLQPSQLCGWLVWGAPLHVPRPEEDDVCIGQGSWQVQGECSVTAQSGMRNLLKQPLFPTLRSYRWFRCLTPGDPSLMHYQWESLGPLFQPPHQPLPPSIPLVSAAVSHLAASMPSSLPALPWDTLLPLCTVLLKRRISDISQKPSQLPYHNVPD